MTKVELEERVAELEKALEEAHSLISEALGIEEEDDTDDDEEDDAEGDEE